MRNLTTWVAFGCLTLPISAHADAQSAATAHLLGIVESVLNYCAARDPASAPRLREQAKAVAQGASEEQLTELRATDEYRTAYDSVVDSTAKVDEQHAKQFCSETFAVPK